MSIPNWFTLYVFVTFTGYSNLLSFFFLIYFKSCKSSIENEKMNKKKPLYVKISEKFKNIKISIK